MTSPDRDIRAALERIAHDTPSLGPIVRQLLAARPEGTLPPAFHAWLKRHSPLSTQQARVLRAVFGDASLFRRPLVDHLSAPLAGRIVDYLRHLPADPLRTAELPDARMPASIARLFATPGRPLGPWLDATVFPLLWAQATGAALPPLPGPLGPTVSPGALRALRPLLTARLLQADTARALLRHPLSAAMLRYYFESAHDALNVRNLMVFLAAVFDGDRDGGRIQNRIPLQLARRFSLPARSVADTLAMMDVLALAYDGFLTPPRRDPKGVHGLFEQPVPEGRAAFWEPAIAPWRHRQLVLSPQQVDEEQAGTFDTSLRYNLARGTGLSAGLRARFADFKPYYARFDAEAFYRAHHRHWKALSPRLARHIGQVFHDPTLVSPPIRARDLANILARDALLPAAEHGLPSVARYALGLPEPQATGRLASAPRPNRGNSPPSARGASEFARFVQRLDNPKRASR